MENIFISRHCSIFLSLFPLCMMSVGAGAQALPLPKGPVILSIGGQISHRNVGDFAEFDADMLDALPVTQFVTTSPWHTAPATFAGPALSSVLQVVGAKGKVLRLIAIDKYQIKVPYSDATEFAPVLARRVDGQALTIRQKGPLLLMYPFDRHPQLKNDNYYARSIWQLHKIVVE